MLLLLRRCSVRFTAYYWVGFAAGLASAGRLDLPRALLGVPMWLCYCLGTEAVNRIAHRDADVVNRPERAALCQEFGWRRMAWAAAVAELPTTSTGKTARFRIRQTEWERTRREQARNGSY